MKLNIYYFLAFIGLLIFSSRVESQEYFKCGLVSQMEKVYQKYPGLKEEQQELMERSLHFVSGGDRADSVYAVYIVPVVFHIIHEDGAENISDDQVYDQLDILNRDYRKLNADTIEIMSEFDTIAADVHIEFRLANLDPFGNCTNGIEHIYSHETNMGDDNSKLNQWPRGRYLNIWVVKSMENGVAGYAYYPSAVSSGLAYADGIIIRHNYIGSIGTSSDFTSRALTHEIGHYLNLPHTWGSTNDPEVACGDDGVDDTPETAGHLSCILTGTDNCNPGQAENVQNYMEYSYCSRMFTNDQAARMRLVLEDVIASRNHLVSAENHVVTGVDGAPVLCTPLPNFLADDQVICEGGTVQFSPSVTRATVDTYSWHFEGGNPENSTDMSPSVTYDTPGLYEVSLTVTNSAGSETETKTAFINVRGVNWQLDGFFSEDFESNGFDLDGWVVENPENNESKWHVYDNAGYSGNHCIGVNYYKSNIDPILDLNYLERLGGTKDVFVTPYYYLNDATSATLNFKYVFATQSSGLYDPQHLALKIYYRKDCQSNWLLLTNMNSSQLNVVGYVGGDFLPNSGQNWNDVFINLPAPALASNVHFKFELTAEDNINNFFIDDINITGVLNTGELANDVQILNVYPNPVENGSQLTVAFQAADEETVNVRVYDLLGQQIAAVKGNSVVGLNQFKVDIAAGIATGVYQVEVETSNATVSKKIVIR